MSVKMKKVNFALKMSRMKVRTLERQFEGHDEGRDN